MALWKPVRYEKRQIITSLGDGINVGDPPFDIKDSEGTYLRNLNSHNYPELSVRYGRTFYNSTMPTLATPNIIGERANSQLHVVDGNTWKYWSTASTAFVNLTTALSSTDGNIQDFNTGSVRYTILMNSTQKKYWDGSSTALNLGDASTPLTKLFTNHRGRIFAAKGATLYYSALNLINDWTTPNDSGSITLSKARGDITGICEYNDHVIIFTEFSMHELYGDSPSNYTLIDIEGNVGCLSHKSIVKVNNNLFWLSKDGVYMYQGATPLKISNSVNDYINTISYANVSKIVAGAINEHYFLSIPYTTSSNDLILVYDAKFSKWYVETGNYIDFVNIQNVLYGLDSTGGIMNMRDITATKDNGTEITWSFISKPFKEKTVSEKITLSDISLVYTASTSGTFNVSYSTSVRSTSFTTLAVSSDLTRTGEEANTLLKIPTTDLNDENWYRLQFNGTGKATIHFLEKNYRIKRR